MVDTRESPILIDMRNIDKRFSNGKDYETVLKDISFTVKQGEVVSLLGESGCGKSTILNLIGGFTPSTKGSVYVAGKLVTEPSNQAMMLFQHYGLFPWRSVLKNAELGLESSSLSKNERTKKAQKYLELVGLGDSLHRFPAQLSGGMQQRVAIARALAIQPELLLMDEPFAALDAFNRYFLQDELLRLQKQEKTTIVLVTHDIDEAVYLSDRVMILDKNPGQIKTIIPIDLPKPRDRSQSDFQHYRRQIFESFSITSRDQPLEYNI